jgi:hypothetical protein
VQGCKKLLLSGFHDVARKRGLARKGFNEKIEFLRPGAS